MTDQFKDSMAALEALLAEPGPRDRAAWSRDLPARVRPAQRREPEPAASAAASQLINDEPPRRRRRRRKPSVAAMIRQARKAGERGAVRVELVNVDGSRAVITSSNQPAADLMADDDAEKLWHERIGRNVAN